MQTIMTREQREEILYIAIKNLRDFSSFSCVSLHETLEKLYCWKLADETWTKYSDFIVNSYPKYFQRDKKIGVTAIGNETDLYPIRVQALTEFINNHL